jgi:hypothetical protein
MTVVITSYVQEVLARKGSPGHVSIAQNAIGILIQLRPAPKHLVGQGKLSKSSVKMFTCDFSDILLGLLDR